MDKLATILDRIIPAEAQSCGNLSKTGAEGKMTCTECGRPLSYIILPLNGRRVLPACTCREAAYMQAERARWQREKNEYLERLFTQSGLGERYRHCSFDNFEEHPGNSAAAKAAQRYAARIGEKIRQGRGLLLSGPLGTGKSHLAAAVVKAAVQNGRTTIMERVPKLLITLRGTYNGGPVTEQQLMRAMTDADLLVLDDAGSEKWTEWTEPTLYTIIDERYNRERAVFITTNLTLDELQQKIGTRAMDRIVDMCDIVETSGPSYRRERARKRLARHRPNTKDK